MKEFYSLLMRFVPPYKGLLSLSVVGNILSALLNLVSFALIVPILKILFKIDNTVYTYMEIEFDGFGLGSLTDLAGALTNNFSWRISQLIVDHGQMTALLLLGVFLIVMTFFKTGVTYLASYFLVPIRTGVVSDLRRMLNDKILALPIGFFSEEHKGDIIARITGDVSEIENSVMSSLDMLFKNPILIITYLVGMFVISWQLTVFVLLVLPFAGYIMGLAGKSLKRRSFVAQTTLGELISQVEETLGGLRIIKAFNAEAKIQSRFEGFNMSWRRIVNRINRRHNLAHPLSEFLGTTTIVIVLWYGGSLILSNNSEIDAATFIYYLIIFYSLINPAKELSKSIYSIQKGFASMERVDRILMAENSITDPADPKEVRFERGITFQHVSFRYQEEWVLRDVNITIEKGKTIALVGQSGSGKSTFVDLIPRFYDVQQGQVMIDSTDVRDLRVHDLRSLMGNVNQEAILFNDTFYNNIAFGVESVTQEQVESAAKIANAHEFIMASEHGYDTTIGDRGGKLSGGQRQRISIARAILKNPQILILDEATSALDTESEKLVQEALDRLMSNRTTIVIAHRLTTIRSADLICVMHQGAIVEQGTHTELLALDGYYRRLVEMQ